MTDRPNVLQLAQEIYAKAVVAEKSYRVFANVEGGEILYDVDAEIAWLSDPDSLVDIAGRCIVAAKAFETAWLGATTDCGCPASWKGPRTHRASCEARGQ